MKFEKFARIVKNHLWLLGIEPTFTLDSDRARWELPPNSVELVATDPSHARILISMHEELLHASEPGPQTDLGAKMLADAIALVFGGPPDPDEDES